MLPDIGVRVTAPGWAPVIVSTARVLVDRNLWDSFCVPFLPPGLSVASRIRSSLSMRPALRRAVDATERLPPGEGVAGAENIVVRDECERGKSR